MLKRLIAGLIASAAPLAAEAPFLELPVDCEMGKTCYIEDYMDADPTNAQRDYRCGLRARDDHNGTDFAIIDWDAMEAGVNVLAAAEGTVYATRDGEPDRVYTRALRDEIAGRECGNAVRLSHDNGIDTLYCHMKQGSVRVKEGDRVEAGTPLGQIGLSGLTSHPHLHIALLKDGGRIDPFAPNRAPDECVAEPGQQLWLDPIPYQPSGFLTAGFSDSVPSFRTVRNGTARKRTLAPTDALVLYARFHDLQNGDVMTFWAEGPEPDSEVYRHSILVKNAQKDMFRAYGKRAPKGGWTKGAYRGFVRLTRGDEVLGQRHADAVIE